MKICEMRTLVKSVYPYPKWEFKINKMTDGQVIAIYCSMLKQGKIKTTVA